MNFVYDEKQLIRWQEKSF